MNGARAFLDCGTPIWAHCGYGCQIHHQSGKNCWPRRHDSRKEIDPIKKRTHQRYHAKADEGNCHPFKILQAIGKRLSMELPCFKNCSQWDDNSKVNKVKPSDQVDLVNVREHENRRCGTSIRGRRMFVKHALTASLFAGKLLFVNSKSQKRCLSDNHLRNSSLRCR